jgi:hypothetical protein
MPRCGVVMQSAAWESRGNDVMRRCEGNAAQSIVMEERTVAGFEKQWHSYDEK